MLFSLRNNPMTHAQINTLSARTMGTLKRLPVYAVFFVATIGLIVPNFIFKMQVVDIDLLSKTTLAPISMIFTAFLNMEAVSPLLPPILTIIATVLCLVIVEHSASSKTIHRSLMSIEDNKDLLAQAHSFCLENNICDQYRVRVAAKGRCLVAGEVLVMADHMAMLNEMIVDNNEAVRTRELARTIMSIKPLIPSPPA